MGKISNFVSEVFIQGVGITRPKPGQEHRAALYITTLLALTVAGAFAMFFLLLHRAF
jgi:hypothetical protein